ncbi:hypothetical protein Sjap_019431 [Stephania japonica]|uniref:Hyaluronan/mRNA-binding protein domain-containing protein n=1 Tax=Stephania japonica TaxID=461633 RepID=A0AAP0HY52_9MAGN
MATINPFDLLGDDENDDPSQLIALHQQKIATLKAAAAEAPAKLPSKPLPPSKLVAEAKKETGAAVPRGGGRGGFGRGRGGRGRDFRSDGRENGYSRDANGTVENGDLTGHEERGRGSYGGPRQPYRGGRRGGFANGDAERDGGWRNSYANRGAERDTERPPRRQFDRRGAYGWENEDIKKDETAFENNGEAIDVSVVTQEVDGMGKIEKKDPIHEKPDGELVSEANKQEKEVAQDEVDKKENEDKEMTLDEYQKILEEKRKALVAMKAEERKVDLDKEFQSMQQLSLKKGSNEVFIKLSADKDTGKKKEESSKDERIKKSVSINEFLKPADGERYFSPRGRRGRGRGDHLNPRGNFGGRSMSLTAAPAIESPGEFPPLK